MSPAFRQVIWKTSHLNMLTGNPVEPFQTGNYFPERVTGGWMLYQTVDGEKDTCVRVVKNPMSNAEMLALLDRLLADPPANKHAPTEAPRLTAVLAYDLERLNQASPDPRKYRLEQLDADLWQLCAHNSPTGAPCDSATMAHTLAKMTAAAPLYAALDAINQDNALQLTETSPGTWVLTEFGQAVAELPTADMLALLLTHKNV